MKIAGLLNNKSKNMSEAKPITIAFLGDSVTQGCFEIYKTGKESIDTVYKEEEGYPYKLKKLISMMYPNVTLNIINAGISGDSASAGLKRVERDVLAYSPDLVIVCFGLNDAPKGIEAISVYAEALEGIFDKLKASHTEIIFMSPNMMTTGVSHQIEDEFILKLQSEFSDVQIQGVMDKYIDCAYKICKSKSINVCDCYGKWKLLYENGVDITNLLCNRLNHPSEEMHWLFAVELFKMIMN